MCPKCLYLSAHGISKLFNLIKITGSRLVPKATHFVLDFSGLAKLTLILSPKFSKNCLKNQT